MKKITLSLAIASALIATPSLAKAESEQFTREGTEFSYTTQQRGDVTVIIGKEKDGTRFRLYVSDDKVRGHYDGNRISFDRSEIGPHPIVTVAQR
ncbi:hypothetical protein [Croceicoccus naphthovorans]|uniref:Uncharacterized protein n=1 Tax=Croceicoccus naphthovorans TaxID=1348774 RepID=A0A0G3XF38_9SPHN|nr:hypothetical protein [Croceicoccus naphthovorans]AKM09817.1 hypothetical protein AB433_07195 [Croceicoccus naphthovorans]MBB3991251.1 hypothetical protein [Croceicoccus naphthovorans]